jgi:hypothetical protein
MLVPPGESVIETKSCRSCGGSFSITDRDLEFYDKISPVFNGKKENIPAPTLCPDCRQRRRLSFRNERKLYKRKCDLTGKDIVSIYSPDKPYKVYDQSAWWGDGWDALEYGCEYDFSRSFAEQYAGLSLAVPVMSLFNLSAENSSYCHLCASVNDCYLSVGVTDASHVHYSTVSSFVENSIDTSFCAYLQESYECVDCVQGYGLIQCRRCQACSSLFSCEDCVNCEECALCVNLANRKFCFLNEPLDESMYRARLADARANPETYRVRFFDLVRSSPKRFAYQM